MAPRSGLLFFYNPQTTQLQGLNDSKKLDGKKREKLFVEIKEKALAWAIAEASAAEIDEINILQASLLAMRRAVEQLARYSLTMSW